MIDTCPEWCSNDHTREPADVHAGRIMLSIDAELIITSTPEDGLTLDIIGAPGAWQDSVRLGPGAAACLAGVLADLTH